MSFRYYYTFLIVLNFVINPLSSQVELIPNGDFEKHAPIITLNSHLFLGKFDVSLPGWTCYNTGPHICDKNYKKSAEEVLKQRACNPPKAGYHSYTTALELNYNKDMVSDDRSHVGYSTYIGCKLNSRLEIGKIYLLSFWVYVFEEARTSPEAHNYLGFKLQTKPKHSKYRVMDKKPTKFLKNLEKEKWQEVRFYIRSLCELEYLKIGYFATEQWPVQDFSPIHVDSSTLDNRVWIDLVSLKEVNEKDVPHEITPTPYCREMETDDKNETISLAPEYLYFAENASTLTAAQEKTLDSIVRFVIQKNPTKVFGVIGHTDNQGSKQKNKVLSEQRAENVKSYLLNRHKLPFWRFSRSGLADDFAVADNSTSEGKSQNRRVEIRASVYEPSMFIYDNILALAARKQLDSAFAMTGLWLRAAPQKKQILLLVDPRASTLRTNFKKWRHLYKEVKKGYS